MRMGIVNAKQKVCKQPGHAMGSSWTVLWQVVWVSQPFAMFVLHGSWPEMTYP